MVTYLPEGSLSPQSPALALSVKMATAINKKKKVPILSRFGLFLVLIWFQNVKGRLFGIGGISCVIFRNWISVVWRENDKRNDVQGKHAFGVLCGGDIVDLCNHVFRKYIASLSIFFCYLINFMGSHMKELSPGGSKFSINKHCVTRRLVFLDSVLVLFSV